MTRAIPQVRRFADRDAFVAHATSVGASFPFADEPASEVLSRPLDGLENRFAILPMEGWDATDDGRPTDLVLRRWRRFGASGAALIWGGEAVAVQESARANPHQLLIGPHVADLREALGEAHETAFGPSSRRPTVGLQLTHSGRFSRADPAGAYDHPGLSGRFPARVLTDGELEAIAGRFVSAARVAADAGFDFVDVKACHGYLGHELLSARSRHGDFGGSLEGRSRFLVSVVDAVRNEVPDVGVAVRMSIFDVPPYTPGDDGVGVAVAEAGDYPHAFGLCRDGEGPDLAESIEIVRQLEQRGVRMICVTGGSPYYSPHVQRPAYFPPSDGYLPPEDPLVGVHRLLSASATLKAAVPAVTVVGSGYSYLQEWLPDVAAGAVSAGWADVIGLGRMALSYPDLPADVLAGRPLQRRQLCRTFSDCTTAPRQGLVSGCWPLDDMYKSRPDRSVLAAAKRSARLKPDDEVDA